MSERPDVKVDTDIPSPKRLDRVTIKSYIKAILWLIFIVLIVISPAAAACSALRYYSDNIRRGTYTVDELRIYKQMLPIDPYALEYYVQSDNPSPSTLLFKLLCVQNWLGIPPAPLPIIKNEWVPVPASQKGKSEYSVGLTLDYWDYTMRRGNTTAIMTVTLSFENSYYRMAKWGNLTFRNGTYYVDIEVEKDASRERYPDLNAVTFSNQYNVFIDLKQALYNETYKSPLGLPDIIYWRCYYNFTVTAYGEPLKTFPLIVYAETSNQSAKLPPQILNMPPYIESIRVGS